MTRDEAQDVLDTEALEIEKLQALFVDGRCPAKNQAEASERLTRLKDHWQESLKGRWRDAPCELTMRQASSELSELRRNSKPTATWCRVLYQVHGTLKIHPVVYRDG